MNLHTNSRDEKRKWWLAGGAKLDYACSLRILLHYACLIELKRIVSRGTHFKQQFSTMWSTLSSFETPFASMRISLWFPPYPIILSSKLPSHLSLIVLELMKLINVTTKNKEEIKCWIFFFFLLPWSSIVKTGVN